MGGGVAVRSGSGWVVRSYYSAVWDEEVPQDENESGGHGALLGGMDGKMTIALVSLLAGHREVLVISRATL